MPVLQGGISKEINKCSYIQTGDEAKIYVPIWNPGYQIQLSHKVVKNRIFKSHFFPAGQLRGFPALRLGASMECRGEKIATCLCHSGPQVPRMSLIMIPRKFSWPPKGISSIDHNCIDILNHFFQNSDQNCLRKLLTPCSRFQSFS